MLLVLLVVVAGLAAATGSSAETSRSLAGTWTGGFRLPLGTEGVGIAMQIRGSKAVVGLPPGHRPDDGAAQGHPRAPQLPAARPAGTGRLQRPAQERRRSSGRFGRERCVERFAYSAGGCPIGHARDLHVRRRAGDRGARHAVLPVDRRRVRLRRAPCRLPAAARNVRDRRGAEHAPALDRHGHVRAFGAGLAACGCSRPARDSHAATAGGSALPKRAGVPGSPAR